MKKITIKANGNAELAWEDYLHGKSGKKRVIKKHEGDSKKINSLSLKELHKRGRT